MDEPDKVDSEVEKKKEPGCIVMVGLYFAILIPTYFYTLPEAETKNFTGRTAHLFSVATFPTDKARPEDFPRVRSLEHVNSSEYSEENETFLLPQSRVFFRGGNPHTAKILEKNADWQLVAFHYSNSHTAILLLFPVWLLSKIIALILAWKQKSAENT